MPFFVAAGDLQANWIVNVPVENTSSEIPLPSATPLPAVSFVQQLPFHPMPAESEPS